FYIPYVTASVSLIGVWMLLFSSGGLVNTILGPLDPDPSWLVNSSLAMPSIALYATWKQLGFYILLYLAALQGIPRELYESASMDGAGVIQRFRHVTVPGVRSVTALVLILAIITGANLFTEPYLLTNGGGPADRLQHTGATHLSEGHPADEPGCRLGDRRAAGDRYRRALRCRGAHRTGELTWHIVRRSRPAAPLRKAAEHPARPGHRDTAARGSRA